MTETITARRAPTHPPVIARRHRGFREDRRGNAVTLLTVYIVLLFAVPSNVTVSALGSLGRPALLWGVVLLLVWVLSRLQTRASYDRPVAQPVRLALGILLTIALVSFAAAMFRGQPVDQVSPAITSVLRLFSWAGVVLVAMDGLRTHYEVSTLIRRLVLGASALAVLGLAQFAAGSTLLEWVGTIPGLTVELGGVDSRGAFTRAAATATHPLEFTATMAACLPIAVATAVAGGYRPGSQWRHAWWIPPALMMVVSILAVSRSATIGIALAAVSSIPGLPRAYRWLVAGGAVVALAAVVALVPGLFGTVVGLFAGASGDPSTQSRTNALARVPEFVGGSPLFGEGFGTFLSRYYIFDNQWVLLLVELGVLGVLAMVGLVGAGMWSGLHAAHESPYEETQTMGRALAASLLTVAVLFLFFDGLSFPISAGVFFVTVGLAAAVRTVGVADRWHAEEAARPAALSPGPAELSPRPVAPTPRRPRATPAPKPASIPD